MSSFTKHTAIYPSDEIGIWVNAEPFRYYVGEKGSSDYIDVPAWYRFDGTSAPMLIGFFIQKVETDTIMSACLHDYLYTHRREYGRMKSDIIFLESLLVYNMPRLAKQKEYLKIILYTIKYSLMYAWLFMFSWVVWYKLEKRIKALFGK